MSSYYPVHEPTFIYCHTCKGYYDTLSTFQLKQHENHIWSTLNADETKQRLKRFRNDLQVKV